MKYEVQSLVEDNRTNLLKKFYSERMRIGEDVSEIPGGPFFLGHPIEVNFIDAFDGNSTSFLKKSKKWES